MQPESETCICFKKYKRAQMVEDNLFDKIPT